MNVELRLGLGTHKIISFFKYKQIYAKILIFLLYLAYIKATDFMRCFLKEQYSWYFIKHPITIPHIYRNIYILMVIHAGAGSPDQSQYHNFLLPVVDFSTNPTSIR